MTALSAEQLRQQVSRLHGYLPANGLVSWTSGNISGRSPGSDTMIIKPSGVMFENLTPETMCEVNINTLENRSDYKYSSDTATHAYIYRHLPEVGGVVHTHSPYATAWAAVGKEIPCFLTAMADEFGGPIPLGGFALIGGEEIGKEIVRVLKNHTSPAIVMQNHGVFSVGETPKDAVKAAVMCEDVAKTSFLACQLGAPIMIEGEDIINLHARYKDVYGQ